MFRYGNRMMTAAGTPGARGMAGPSARDGALRGLGDWPSDPSTDVITPTQQSAIDALLVQGVSLVNAIAQAVTGRPLSGTVVGTQGAGGLGSVTPWLLLGGVVWLVASSGKKKRARRRGHK